jgi:hypothetical protein
VEAFGCNAGRPSFEVLTAFGAPPEQASLLSKEWQRISSGALQQLPYLPASKVPRFPWACSPPSVK